MVTVGPVRGNTVRVMLDVVPKDGREARKLVAAAVMVEHGLKLAGAIGKPDRRGYLVCVDLPRGR